MFDLPVIAYEAGAVPSTMGESGILIREKKIDLISGIIDELQRSISCIPCDRFST